MDRASATPGRLSVHGRSVFVLVGLGGYVEELVADVGALVPLPLTVAATEAVALGVNALVARTGLDARPAQGRRTRARPGRGRRDRRAGNPTGRP